MLSYRKCVTVLKRRFPYRIVNKNRLAFAIKKTPETRAERYIIKGGMEAAVILIFPSGEADLEQAHFRPIRIDTFGKLMSISALIEPAEGTHWSDYFHARMQDRFEITSAGLEALEEVESQENY